MQVNNENAPEIIFEWLSQPYHALSEEQKSKVQRFFSAEEFNEMHLAVTAIDRRKKPSDSMYRIKQNLLLEFDRKFESGKVRSLFARLDVWKVAAVFFFLSGSWFAVDFFRPENFMTTKTVTLTDTVYMEKKYYDTVFVPSVTENSVRANQARSTLHSSVTEAISGNFQVRPETLNVLSLDMLNNEENVQKGNSLRDDSLISSFNFITL